MTQPFIHQEVPGSINLNAREQHLVVGKKAARVNGTNVEKSELSLDDGNLMHLCLEGKGENYGKFAFCCFVVLCL